MSTAESPVLIESRKAVRDQIEQLSRVRRCSQPDAADIARTTFKENRELSKGTLMYDTWDLMFRIADEEVRRGVR